MNNIVLDDYEIPFGGGSLEIAVWSDYDWCYTECLEDYLVFKFDDFKIVSLPDSSSDPSFEFIKGVADGI